MASKLVIASTPRGVKRLADFYKTNLILTHVSSLSIRKQLGLMLLLYLPLDEWRWICRPTYPRAASPRINEVRTVDRLTLFRDARQSPEITTRIISDFFQPPPDHASSPPQQTSLGRPSTRTLSISFAPSRDILIQPRTVRRPRAQSPVRHPLSPFSAICNESLPSLHNRVLSPTSSRHPPRILTMAFFTMTRVASSEFTPAALEAPRRGPPKGCSMTLPRASTPTGSTRDSAD